MGEIVEQVAVDPKTLPKAVISDMPLDQPEHATAEIPINQIHGLAKSEVPLVKPESEVTDNSESTSEKRPANDLIVFKYYFVFVNWRRATIFIVFQTCLAFLSSFPGMCNLPFSSSVPSSLGYAILTFLSRLAKMVDGREPGFSRQQNSILHWNICSFTGCCACRFRLGNLVSGAWANMTCKEILIPYSFRWTLNVLAVATGFRLHETLANTVMS